ncbi:cytochrome c [Methylococcus sp. EFPC2]|uniref:c-type cytochrome n=1 Tax=Methylococcus sp. EFPC2 TaxID=2812648 RepID=UPI0019683FE8|nr:cytochrome c [Methylococcus sp. EFPC2]QSA98035.1 cytochrome c [Methylococcus sp. EFPC2]
MSSAPPRWSSEDFWKKVAIWVTSGSFVILIFLTFDSLAKVQAGGSRVQAYSVVNKAIDYRFDAKQNRFIPVIGGDEPLFGRVLSEEEAEKLVTLGKKTIQAKNCINCHTLLGNGAYYAPDLTKAWLDPGWIDPSNRENLLLSFLQDPEKNARTFSGGRKMPNLGITEAEARGVVAFLKWMSAIDTNGFPHNFVTLTSHDEDEHAPSRPEHDASEERKEHGYR